MCKTVRGWCSCASAACCAELGPAPAHCEISDPTRYRVQQTARSEVRNLNRRRSVGGCWHQTDELLTDVMGASGRAMVEALVAGTTIGQVLQIWHAANCARNCRRCNARWWDGSGRRMRFCSSRSARSIIRRGSRAPHRGNRPSHRPFRAVLTRWTRFRASTGSARSASSRKRRRHGTLSQCRASVQPGRHVPWAR